MNKILKSDINKLTAKEKLRLIRLLVDSFDKVEVECDGKIPTIRGEDIFLINQNKTLIIR